jgi:hypothetical protein
LLLHRLLLLLLPLGGETGAGVRVGLWLLLAGLLL